MKGKRPKVKGGRYKVEGVSGHAKLVQGSKIMAGFNLFTIYLPPLTFSLLPLSENFFLSLCCRNQIFSIFAVPKMVAIAQLVRASDCGSEGRRFEPG